MRSIKRTAALFLALTIVLGLCAVTQAGTPLDDSVVTILNSTITIAPGGTKEVIVRISTTDTSAELVAATPQNSGVISSMSLVSVNGVESTTAPLVAANNSAYLSFEVGAPLSLSGQSTKIDFYFKGNSVPITKDVTVVLDKSPTEIEGESGGAVFRVSSVDKSGAKVSAPKGNHGENIKVRLPLIARDYARDITVSPVITTSLDTFPFDINTVDYTLTYPDAVYDKSILEFQYEWTLSKKVTAGVKQVDFNVTYKDYDGKLCSDKVSVFVTVVKGAAAEGAVGTDSASTPKLIIEGYSISSDKVFAGDTFDVKLTVKNTSSEEAIKNLKISIKDSLNVVLPANNGSNTIYVEKIGKGESYTQTISLQTAPDAEAKAYTLAVECDYEGVSTKKEYTATETITVPILQMIRLKADDPVVYDEGWVGQSCAMFTALYNMGKSSIYNCMLSVEGDGLRMEETYFGGTVAAGSTMRADFNIVTDVAGDIAGTVVITYEDVYGEQSEMRLPFNVFVNEEMPYEDVPVDGELYPEVMPVQNPGMPWWAWVLIVLAAAGGVVVLIVVLKRRRAHQLEDI